MTFAETAAADWSPAPVFVMDIGQSGDTLYIIEVNCFNSSGFYASEVQQLRFREVLRRDHQLIHRQLLAAVFILTHRMHAIGALMFFGVLTNVVLITYSLSFKGTIYVTSAMFLANLYPPHDASKQPWTPVPGPRPYHLYSRAEQS